MSTLFESTKIAHMPLSNRFVRSATWEGLAASDGTCTPELIEFYTRLANGKIGLIITGHTYVRPEGIGSPRQIGLSDDKFIPGLRELTDAIHRCGSSIVAQLSHGGILSNESVTGLRPLIVSKVDGYVGSAGKEMSEEDISGIIEAFAQAALRAKKAGFDGVQIHGAHGFLGNQFLSPAFNKRTDKYGGTVRNRIRIMLEIINEMRKLVGKEFPILYKINSEDCIANGVTVEDSLDAVGMLQEEGIDGIELSGGTVITLDHCRENINTAEKEAYWKKSAKIFKESIDVPLILVGGIRSIQVAEKLLKEGYADYCSMSRPFIREPNLISRWIAGDLEKSKCLSDNLCRGPLLKGEGVTCVVQEKSQKEGKLPRI